MKNKRITAVRIFAWLFIIGGISGLIGMINFKAYRELLGEGKFTFIVYILGAITSICSLFCGIYLLKLKSWARSSMILLCLVYMFSSPLSYKAIMRSLELSNREFIQKEQLIIKRYEPTYRKIVLEDMERARLKAMRLLPIIIAIGGVITELLYLITIYFFTRPKTKQLFE